MRLVTVALALCCACSASSGVRAGVIRVLPSGGGHLISAHSPIGQTFTAEDSLVTVGLHIRPFTQGTNPERSLLVQLFDGEGVGGPVLDARTVEPPAGFVGYLDVDYSHLELEPGNDYSVTLSSNSDHWISDSSLGTPDYAGGVAIITGALAPHLPDKAFQVVPIPEPMGGAVVSAFACAAARRYTRGGRRSRAPIAW